MKQEIHIHGNTGLSKIVTGILLSDFREYLPEDGQIIVVSDPNIWEIYGDNFQDYPVILTEPGEANKNLASVQSIYEKLMELEADRSTFVLGLGGGIVCDMAGFAANTYMRGLRFGFIATTLLAQVDASTGGKNGVNFHGYKNMIGTFRQPEFVLCPSDVLKTLPNRELSNGFAEIIKHGLIADAGEFDALGHNYDEALRLESTLISKVVYHSVSIKAAIVNRDESEKDERRKLNFGHTFGHAIERTTGISHGQAVALGMMVAAELSRQKGMLPGKDLKRIRETLIKYRLPVKMTFDRDAVSQALINDKKREGDTIHFILLNGIGKAVIKPVSLSELRQAIHAGITKSTAIK